LYGFFLSTIQGINKRYHNLFRHETGNEGGGTAFMERWGWVNSTKQVAEFEGITVSAAYNMNIIPYLNTLAYLKDYNKYKEAEHKKWQLQLKNR
jgi:hypothetical protein